MKTENDAATVVSIIAVVGLVVAVLVMTFNYSAPRSSEIDDTISVSGTSEMTILSDEAFVFVEVVTKGATAKEAQDQNAVIGNSVMDALEAYEVETESFDVSIQQKWDEKQLMYIDTGYQARLVLKVKTNEVSDVGAIVETAIDAGATGIQRIEYALSKDKEAEIKEQALNMAITAAKQKAANMAESADVELGDIKSISENSFYYMPYFANVKAEADGAGQEFGPKKLEISSSVSIVYEIEN